MSESVCVCECACVREREMCICSFALRAVVIWLMALQISVICLLDGHGQTLLLPTNRANGRARNRARQSWHDACAVRSERNCRCFATTKVSAISTLAAGALVQRTLLTTSTPPNISGVKSTNDTIHVLQRDSNYYDQKDKMAVYNETFSFRRVASLARSLHLERHCICTLYQ